MTKPTYSVIIPALNEEKFLPKLLETLVSQTRKDFEVIVVDGASTDATVAVAKRFAKKLPALRVVTMTTRGISMQRNAGAALAHADWLIFLDADGEVLPYFIERIDAFIKAKKPTLFTSWFRPDNETSGDAFVTLFANMFVEAGNMLHRPVAPGPLAVVSRQAFEKVGGYNETITWGEDYEFTSRICRDGVPLMFLRETLYNYSMRRLRHQGTLKMIQQYGKAVFSVLITRKPPQNMPDYVMGGHLYHKKKPVKKTVIQHITKQIRAWSKELFE